jgi:hypothetical protein
MEWLVFGALGLGFVFAFVQERRRWTLKLFSAFSGRCPVNPILSPKQDLSASGRVARAAASDASGTRRTGRSPRPS